MDFVKYIVNTFLSRSQFHEQLVDGRYKTRDIDKECGYPEQIGIREYIYMYRRNDVAARVVDVEPNECWKEYPEIYETEEERETTFEQAVDDLLNRTNLFMYLARLDRISGIGRYGVMFIGLDDGNEFSEPAPGFTEHEVSDSPGDAEVLYYRIFDESAVTIAQYESDTNNPRYGFPLYYNIQFSHLSDSGVPTNATPETRTEKVHWSRVIHVADNVTTSEIFGAPRMENVYNRLMDLRKINGGAGEMFYKGGFPGYTFEVDPREGELTEEEREAIKDEIQKYEEGLSRYFAGVGVKMSSLLPQIAPPGPFIDNALKIIATTKGIPMRLLTGSEAGHLASTQDSATWTERVALRRNMYVTPMIIRQTIDRMQQYGALPQTELVDGVSKGYTVKWTPLADLTEVEKSEVGLKRTEALARYATSGGEALVPLNEFLTKFLKLTFQEAEAIVKAPRTELSPVLQELAAGLSGMAGSANGNIPSSIPDTRKTKDPSKTPPNMVQKPKAKETDHSPSTPPTTQE